jgi:hypothetical protein
MTYYVGNENNLSDLLGQNNPRYFYALRRTEQGDLYFAKIDQIKDSDTIVINDPGLTENNFEDFQYGVDFFDGRTEAEHDRPFTNFHWDQYRWDSKNTFYYINDNGEFVVRINQQYKYDALFTGSIAGTTMTVTAVEYGVLQVGMTLRGTGVDDNITITAVTPGTFGGIGTYTVSNTQTVTSTVIEAVF